MIGSGFKKYAAENGMKVDAGVAYGSLHGYAATLCEGAGYKQIAISTRFADPAKSDALRIALNSYNLSRDYRVQNIYFMPEGIQIVFLDNPGTMKKIEAFMDLFIPMLAEYGAAGVDVCAECGMQITGGDVWMLYNGALASHVHEGCCRRAQEKLAAENDARKEADSGSYVTGIVGALLGAILGAVAWGVLAMSGMIVGLAGLLIGFLAKKGYDLLKGKQGKGKIPVLIVSIIFGVLLGTFLGMCLSLGEIVDGVQVQWFHVPWIVMDMVLGSSEYQGYVIRDVLMGLLFSGLCTYGMIAREGRNLAEDKLKVLK